MYCRPVKCECSKCPVRDRGFTREAYDEYYCEGPWRIIDVDAPADDCLVACQFDSREEAEEYLIAAEWEAFPIITKKH